MLTKQVYPLVNDKSWQSLLIKDGTLFLMNKSFQTEEAFLASYEKKGIFKQKKEVAIADITRLAHPENKPGRLDIAAVSGKLFLNFTRPEDLNEVVAYLQEKRRFTAETVSVTTLKAISPGLTGLLITAALTWLMWMDATKLEAGETINTSGRRSEVKKIFAWLAGQLGSQGTLIAGGVVAFVFLFLMWKRMQQPPNEVVYQ